MRLRAQVLWARKPRPSRPPPGEGRSPVPVCRRGTQHRAAMPTSPAGLLPEAPVSQNLPDDRENLQGRTGRKLLGTHNGQREACDEARGRTRPRPMTLRQIQPRPADSPAGQEGGGAQAPNPAVPIVPIAMALAVPRHTLHGQGDPKEPLGPWNKQLIYEQGTAGPEVTAATQIDKLRRKAPPHTAWPSVLTCCHLQRNLLDCPARRSPS